MHVIYMKHIHTHTYTAYIYVYTEFPYVYMKILALNNEITLNSDPPNHYKYLMNK